MAIAFPSIDPVAIALGPVQVRWYGLAYLAGLVLGWLYMRSVLRQERLWNGAPPMRPEQTDDFLLWATLGVVLGGRLGYVLFYDPALYLAEPWRIVMTWQGGMAFHGGLLGMIAAIALFSRWNRIPFLSLGDLTAAVVPIGLFFGRLANFINGEVYGKITDVPWAVVFPAHVLNPGDAVAPRHPSQLYEAFLEGIVLFLVLRYLTHRRQSFAAPGLTAGVFLVGYGAFRIVVEMFFRVGSPFPFFPTPYVSAGMIYSLPMVIFGLYLIVGASRRPSRPNSQQMTTQQTPASR